MLKTQQWQHKNQIEGHELPSKEEQENENNCMDHKIGMNWKAHVYCIVSYVKRRPAYSSSQSVHSRKGAAASAMITKTATGHIPKCYAFIILYSIKLKLYPDVFFNSNGSSKAKSKPNLAQ